MHYLNVKSCGHGKWSLNGGSMEVELRDDHKFDEWIVKHTNVNNACRLFQEYCGPEYFKEEEVVENFLNHGFTPWFGYYGSKTPGEKGERPKYELNNRVSWFTFDGLVARDGDYLLRFGNEDIYSIAVSYDINNKSFTVYHNELINKSRIGIYDDIEDIFNLAEGCLPIKIYDKGNALFDIDWDKVRNRRCYADDEMEGTIFSADLRIKTFEERLGSIINRVCHYLYGMGFGDFTPNGFEDNVKLRIKSSERFGGVSVSIIENEEEKAVIGFMFVNKHILNVLLYEWNDGSMECVESISIDRQASLCTFEDGRLLNLAERSKSLDEEVIGYLPHLGVSKMYIDEMTK